MDKDDIRLKDAMTLPLNHQIRSWDVPGLQVDVDELQPNATVTRTVVMKDPDTNYQLGISWNINGDKRCFGVIAEFSTLEELQDKYPQLFELDGHLHAFA